MINQSTIDKLIEMRLTAMADAFRIQMNDTSIPSSAGISSRMSRSIVQQCISTVNQANRSK